MRVRCAVMWLVLVTACGPRIAPEGPAVPVEGKRVESRRGMVSASHPDAARAGAEVLAAGGNSADAAAAVGFALAVVDPSQTGLGGGGVATIYRARDKRTDVLHFYARSGSGPQWSMRDTTPSGPINGRDAGVPGAVRGLLQLQSQWGRLDRARVLAPAIRLARDGFIVSPLLSRTIASARAKLTADSASSARFLPGGAPLQAGDRLVQGDLATLLERIATDGGDAFYRGAFAERLSAAVSRRGGSITASDLANYTTRVERPVCGVVGGYRVVGAGPSMGGTTVIEALMVLDATRSESFVDHARDPAAAQRMISALRIAQADTRGYGGDPAVAGLASPVRGLSSASYVGARARAAVGDTAFVSRAWEADRAADDGACAAVDPYPAAPVRAVSAPPSGQEEEPVSFTSHLSVVDAEGNAVGLTYTVGTLFGSAVNVDGVFLNSGGANFNTRTRGPDRFANSTIAPTIVLDDRGVRLVIGAGGSQYIPTSVTQVAWRILVGRMDPWLAIASPRLQTAGTARDLEMEPGFAPEIYSTARRDGLTVVSRVADLMFGGVHLVYVTPDGRRIGAADPRRDGAAASP
jgi:gamma-glutamyltranspeptidase / glutathione hydrolase